MAVSEARAHLLFPTRVFSANVTDTAVTDLACKLAYKFADACKEPLLVSAKWDLQERSAVAEIKAQYGVTSFGDNRRLFDDPAWHPVADAILDACRSMLSQYSPELAANVMLETMWLSIYPEGGYIPEHNHANALFSGSFYVKAEPGAGGLTFRDPAWMTKTALLPIVEGQPIGASTTETCEVNTGKIVLFPGYLPHTSVENNSGQDRIIIGFNLNMR